MSSSSSSSSSSFVNSSGAGSVSHSAATSASGETSTSSQAVFTPGATSSSGAANATASSSGVDTSATATTTSGDANASTEPESERPILTFLFGTEQTDRLNTQHRDLFIGSSNVDSFVLSATGVPSVLDADIILNFNVADGDRLQLPDEIATANLVLQVIDLNQDGVLDSTAIRLGEEGNILAIALNTVDETGSTHLSSLVISNATISTSLTPLTWSREVDSASSPTPIPTINYVLGTVQNDVISSTTAYDVLTGFGGADTFVLDSTGGTDVSQADVIADFNWVEGDRLGLPNNIAFDALQLQGADLDRNGLVESTVIQVGTTGAILAVALNTVDLAGQTMLNSDSFVMISS